MRDQCACMVVMSVYEAQDQDGFLGTQDRRAFTKSKGMCRLHFQHRSVVKRADKLLKPSNRMILAASFEDGPSQIRSMEDARQDLLNHRD